MAAETTQAPLAELLRNHERFPALFHGIDRPTALCDLAGNLVAANSAALVRLGHPFEELAGRRFEAFVEPAAKPALRRAFVRACRGRSSRVVARLQGVAGDDVFLEATLLPALVDGAIAGVYASGDDAAAARRAEQRWYSLFNYHTDAVIAIDRFGYMIEANPACERVLGYTTAELRGRPYTALVAPEMLAHTAEIFKRGLAGESATENTVIINRDGRRVQVAGTLLPIVLDGIVVGMHAIGRDVTTRDHLERSAREQTERIRELCFVAASAGESAEAQIASALDLGSRRLGCSGAYLSRVEGERLVYLRAIGNAAPLEGQSRALDGSRERAILRSAQPVSGFDDAAYIGASLVIGGARSGAVTFVSPAARAPFTAPDFDFTRLIGTLVASAVERDERARNLDALAFSDALTGLPNRLMLRERLAAAIAEAERDGFSFALHFYDLDGFKRINDRHGHLRGDDVLKTVARRMATVSQGDHTLARIGGDEFVVLQPRVRDRAEAARAAHRLCDAVGEPFRIDGFEHRLSLSAGIAFFPQDARDADALLERADAALYRVKSRGRNAIAFADGRVV